MWVLTESGELVNLDLVEAIDLVGNARLLVEAYYPRDGGSRILCTCDDEEHGRRIIGELARTINVTPKGSIRVIVMDQIKKRAKARGEAS